MNRLFSTITSLNSELSYETLASVLNSMAFAATVPKVFPSVFHAAYAKRPGVKHGLSASQLNFLATQQNSYHRH